MNANAFHNIVNIMIALLAALTAFLTATGCTADVGGTLECSKSWLDPAYTGAAIAVLAAAKTVVNIFRDGLSGLFKIQPPVEK